MEHPLANIAFLKHPVHVSRDRELINIKDMAERAKACGYSIERTGIRNFQGRKVAEYRAVHPEKGLSFSFSARDYWSNEQHYQEMDRKLGLAENLTQKHTDDPSGTNGHDGDQKPNGHVATTPFEQLVAITPVPSPLASIPEPQTTMPEPASAQHTSTKPNTAETVEVPIDAKEVAEINPTPMQLLQGMRQKREVTPKEILTVARALGYEITSYPDVRNRGNIIKPAEYVCIHPENPEANFHLYARAFHVNNSKFLDIFMKLKRANPALLDVPISPPGEEATPSPAAQAIDEAVHPEDQDYRDHCAARNQNWAERLASFVGEKGSARGV